MTFRLAGEVAERLKAHAWKACVGFRLPRVRIPLSPPLFDLDGVSKSPVKLIRLMIKILHYHWTIFCSTSVKFSLSWDTSLHFSG
jgi:hypothetical protein